MRKIKIVQFIGGLGNQMFQYAFYKALEKEGFDARADLSGFDNYNRHNGFELSSVFNIHLKIVSKRLLDIFDKSNKSLALRFVRRILGLRKTRHDESLQFQYDPGAFGNKHNLLSGYWQNLQYLNKCEADIRNDFVFSAPDDKLNKEYLEKINSCNSVAVHVRRGDYLGDPLLGGICSADYYLRAIEHFNKNLKACHFFIFSNDLEWCKKQLNMDAKTFVSGNNGENSFRDMQLMSACKHNIIANSSFSWWAAWLNSNPNKIVISPSKWVNDKNFNTQGLIPNEWIQI